MAKAKYKLVSFTTTIRNPECIPAFLKCLSIFEGQALTKDIINGAGIARHELPILICWKNNDAEAVYKYIKDIRRAIK